MSPSSNSTAAAWWPVSLVQLEALTLVAFAFVLPQFEAPKNLLWVVYAALWVANRWRNRSFGGAWTTWDSVILAWIATGYLSALFAGLHGTEWKAAFDVVRYGSMLWLIRRGGYSGKTLLLVLIWGGIGTVAALIRGYYEITFFPRADGQRRYLGLNSVGHVNHSAIYLAIVFAAALAWVRSAWRTDSMVMRLAGALLCIGFLVGLFVMESRATVGVALVIAMAILLVYAVRSGIRPWKSLGAAVLVVLAVAMVRPEVVEKNTARLKQDNLFAHRDNIWRVGMKAWQEFPVFGVGMGNYGKIDYEKLEKWAHDRSESFDRASLLTQAHAHSLYVNTLAERGLVGSIAVLTVLLLWMRSLVSRTPGLNDPPLLWAYWGGALGAWLVAVLVGLVNTTLHHEHALVSMLLLGGWLSLSGHEQKMPAPA